MSVKDGGELGYEDDEIGSQKEQSCRGLVQIVGKGNHGYQKDSGRSKAKPEEIRECWWEKDL